MSEKNRRRWHAVLTSRSVKSIFQPGDHARGWRRMLLAFVAFAFAGPAAWRTWCYRAVFTVEGGGRQIAADHVLSDLRDFCFARTPAFDPDPIIMARRQGRRDVWLRISNYLNLDEAQVQTLMEIDDGY